MKMHPAPPCRECEQLRAEVSRLRDENQRLTEANHSVAVCANHTAEIIGTGCLVCEVERLRGLIQEGEREGYFQHSSVDCSCRKTCQCELDDWLVRARAALVKEKADDV